MTTHTVVSFTRDAAGVRFALANGDEARVRNDMMDALLGDAHVFAVSWDDHDTLRVRTNVGYLVLDMKLIDHALAERP